MSATTSLWLANSVDIGCGVGTVRTQVSMAVIFMGAMIDFLPEEVFMSYQKGLAALALAAVCGFASAQQKELKIGFIYDVTGPFAGGGSEAAQIGTRSAIDMFNEKGGIEGYKINAIFVDAQSKVDVAINEMTRLIDQEKRSEE